MPVGCRQYHSGKRSLQCRPCNLERLWPFWPEAMVHVPSIGGDQSSCCNDASSAQPRTQICHVVCEYYHSDSDRAFSSCLHHTLSEHPDGWIFESQHWPELLWPVSKHKTQAKPAPRCHTCPGTCSTQVMPGSPPDVLNTICRVHDMGTGDYRHHNEQICRPESSTVYS